MRPDTFSPRPSWAPTYDRSSFPATPAASSLACPNCGSIAGGFDMGRCSLALATAADSAASSEFGGGGPGGPPGGAEAEVAEG